MISSNVIDKVENIIREASEFVRNETRHFQEEKIQHKSSFDLVSYVDVQTQQFLINNFSKLLPNAGFIAEEEHIQSTKEWNWIIDPLDGTTNFTRQLPSYAISVALAKEKEIRYGWVLNIPMNEFFSAIKGDGAFLNKSKIRVSNKQNFQDALFATGFSVSVFDDVDVQLSVVKEIITHSLGIRRMGAAAVDLCYVACGKFDGFFEWHLNPWDVAAGALIAEEAGAKVSDFSGHSNYLFGKQIIAAQPNIYPQLLSIIQNKMSTKKI